jgi:hypothetical protein
MKPNGEGERASASHGPASRRRSQSAIGKTGACGPGFPSDASRSVCLDVAGSREILFGIVAGLAQIHHVRVVRTHGVGGSGSADAARSCPTTP